MKALRVQTLGEEPQILDVEDPVPGPGEVLIKVGSCALNFADLLMIKGQYQDMPALPFSPGMEMAGTVLALGEGVQTPAPGTRVAAFSGHGGLADLAVVPAKSLTPIPDEMDFATASAFQIAYGTSHLALTRRARLKAGETLLVLGAAGGVGLTAVELGKRLGATVIASARGQEKLAVAKAAGADHLIDSEAQSIRDVVRELGGADVVYDPIGGEQFSDALRATKPEGRIIVIGFASGDVPQIPANHLLVKNITVEGFYWGGYQRFNPSALTQSMEDLFAMYARGELKPHISHRFSLDQVKDAIEVLRSRKSTGKVVVVSNQT